MYKYSTIYTKNNMKGLVGTLCWWGARAPCPPSPLNPALLRVAQRDLDQLGGNIVLCS